MCSRKSLQLCGLVLWLAACGTDNKPASTRDGGAPTGDSQVSAKGGNGGGGGGRSGSSAKPAVANTSQFPGSGTGNATDLTTWKVSIRGNPVHLVVP